ncbi:33905_t:CDS:2, partial [Racocetra persica]
DAKKEVIFESFSLILHLQLKWFEYDMQRDIMIKFTIEIDLQRYLSLDTDKSQSSKYLLHG